MGSNIEKIKRFSILVYAFLGILGVFLCQRMVSRVEEMAPDNVIYVAREASIYPDANASSIAIATVKKGQKLILSEKGEKFSKISDGTITGYIKTEYLSERPPD